MFIMHNRLEEIKKLVETIVTKTLLPSAECLVTNLELYIVVDNTVMYVLPLKEIDTYISDFAFKYKNFMSNILIDNIDSNSAIDISVIIDNYLFDKLYCLKNYYTFNMNDINLVARNLDLKNTESFEKYIKISSSDGMKYYKIPSIENLDLCSFYLIPIFTGFPSVTSQDKLGISVYDTHDGFLICRFDIFKKKINRDIIMIFKIINLTRR